MTRQRFDGILRFTRRRPAGLHPLDSRSDIASVSQQLLGLAQVPA